MELKQIINDEITILNTDIEKIEIKMTYIINKYGIGHLEKINKLNLQKEIKENQVNKLYEILGKYKG